MDKKQAQRVINRVRNSIEAQQIVEKLQNSVLSADKLDGATVSAAKMLLEIAGAFDEQQANSSNHVVIDVSFSDPSQAQPASIEAVAAPVLGQPPAIQHSGDPPEGRQDILGDSVATVRGDELPPE